ncbi:hypothetical protein CC78DRAFT_589291 [Lojkania enalia]|uniref:Uncharacterized protein n=1 Tax=Lojkania enalia TaxID=147567 RepID=A0A9P4N3C3_9PLEO|nr:hypothetical protein CC78DRAFT_589291 [Didymosphaeria enalia]
MYYGRHVEPLAFSLADKPIAPQWLCPLFSKIPIEIREMVYEYAFIDCNSMPLDWNNPYRDHPITHHEGIDHGKHIPHSDISFNFLQTCRAVYLEAYQLPLLLNPFIVYRFGSLPSYDVTRPRFVQLAPWQFALIQRLDISLQQIALEGDQLAKYLKIWKAKERHEGALVAPRFYQESRNTYPGVIIQSFNFGIIPYHNPLEDSVAISLKNKRTFYSRNRSSYPVVSTARAMIARPLTHLTLRLSRTDWRTWTDSDMGDPTRELGLDPAFGDGGSGVTERPTAARMQYLAAERRANRWPGQQPNDDGTSSYRYISGWGAEIAKLPDLKTLELVLETFDTKKLQLETVADCAKTWIFPLEGTQHQLVWDGKIEALRYQCYDESSTLTNGTQRVLQQISSPPYSPTVEWTEVRIIRFRRRKVQ